MLLYEENVMVRRAKLTIFIHTAFIDIVSDLLILTLKAESNSTENLSKPGKELY